MIEEEALLRAVIADPDDDAPRLIYADWLDEQGQCERAEFIRLQCALAGQAPHGVRPRDLLRREQELLAAHGLEWAYPVSRLVEAWTFRRGFIYRVTCPAPNLINHAKGLFGAAPVEHLHLRGVRGAAKELFCLSDLGNLRSLDLSHNGLGDKGVGHLGRCSYLTGLVTLDLTHNGIRAVGARSLAISPYLSALEVLILRENTRLRDADRQLLVRRFRDRVHF